jgi:exopolysaccharide biosynthesis polyprenyl glycosylphosphotransferase
MFRRFSINFSLFSIGLDALIIVIALIFTQYLRPELNTLPFVATISKLRPFPGLLYGIFPVLWVMIFLLFSIYDGRRNLRAVDEFSSLISGSVLAAIAGAGIMYLSYREVSRAQYLLFVVAAIVGVCGWRSLARLAFRLTLSRPGSSRNILVVGSGQVGRQFQEQILKQPYLGLKVVGFLDDDPEKHNYREDILGTLDDAKTIIAKYAVDDVVIALPKRAYERTDLLMTSLHKLPVGVWIIPDYFQWTLSKAITDDYAGIPMFNLRAPALNEYQRMVKRGFDLLLTFMLMPPTLILMGMVAIAIRLEGPGPILFKQKRVGENGRLFEMLKFRSMVPNAEELRHLVEHHDDQGHLIHKVQDDPRVTRVGRFLRKTSLDEVPQLFNILRGEMSWVGPRPELPYLVEKYEYWQRKRFAVPQGLTGWWQVNGRSERMMHLNTEYDLYYVKNYSLLLDIYILIKTVLVIFRGRGAY